VIKINGLTLLRLLDEYFFFPMRRNRLTKLLVPHINSGDIVLDVGSSCGRLASEIIKNTGCKVEGIDVLLQLHTHIPVRQYDGCHFPFGNSSFDIVMMIDMLHHTVHHEQVLREAVRVSRRYLLIKDHFWETQADKTGLRFTDYIGNAPYGIDLPYNYLRIVEWIRVFNQLGLRIVDFSQYKYSPLDPSKNIIFKLEK